MKVHFLPGKSYLVRVNVLIRLCWKTSQTMTLSSTFRERERRRGDKASILELVDLVSRPVCTKSHRNAYESTEGSVKLQVLTR